MSRIFCNNMGNSYSIYRLGHHDLRDNTEYQLFLLELEESYTASLLGRNISSLK